MTKPVVSVSATVVGCVFVGLASYDNNRWIAWMLVRDNTVITKQPTCLLKYAPGPAPVGRSAQGSPLSERP